MQTEAQEAFDLGQRDRRRRATLYGDGEFADACLIARRLVERGVRMVQVYYGDGQPWDDHGDIDATTATRRKQSDQPIAALLTDLKARGLLDDTLVLWGGEFGRTPTSRRGQGPRPQQPRLHACGWPAAASRAAWPTARPTSSASPPSRTGCTSTTCTPRSCT